MRIKKLRIQSLYVYPIKSCAGISLNEVQVSPWGFEQDHRFMLVKNDGSHISQREYPCLCQVKTSLQDDSVIIEIPKVKPVSLSFFDKGEKKEVSVHGMSIFGYDQGDELANYFSDFIESSCRLVMAHRFFMRSRTVAVYGSALTTTFQLAFQDSSPIHLLTSASLQDLDERQVHVCSVNRFRPNIVIAGEHLMPNCEDKWATVYIKSMTGAITRFTTRKRAERCAIPGIDQATGEKKKEPLATLASYRRGEYGKVYFGTYLIPTVFNPANSIAVGDEVSVEEVAAPQ